jgi:SPW repeat
MSSFRTTQSHRSVSRSHPTSILDVYTLLLAVFLFVSPWLFAYANGVVRADLWVSSALIATISAAAILAFSEWEDWLNLLLGLWLVAAPWLLGFAHTRAMHLSVGVGGVIAYLAALELWLAHYGDTVGIGSETHDDSAR